jgi:hypothetical protein
MTLRLLVGLLNMTLGVVYTSYGFMAMSDLRRGVATRGELHFGRAWVAMAFTCGPHHFEHGLHVQSGDRLRGYGDVVAVVAGLYDLPRHLQQIDWLAVPSALYIVWVVRALYRGELSEPAPMKRAVVV